MKFFITGHTGFKGTWLSKYLLMQGHQVSGYALEPEIHSTFSEIRLNQELSENVYGNILNLKCLQESLKVSQPDVVIHLAAQPLVRYSYIDPLGTIDVNVTGTMNVLSASSITTSVKAILIITTDKVYKNLEKITGYIESDALGGFDPYSSSKAAADILTQSWFQSFQTPPIGIARAGNVIGGGDWGKDRLVPDAIRSFTNNIPLVLRYPKSVRPWQHVLDCLNGYDMFIDYLLSNKVNEVMNFGPMPSSMRDVQDVASKLADRWGKSAKIELGGDSELHETGILTLNSEKARNFLGWKDFLDLDTTLNWTVDFYKKRLSKLEVENIISGQITDYLRMKSEQKIDK